MPKYENSKIYKIIDNTNGNIYVGSTTEKYLSRRLGKHKWDYNKWKSGEFNRTYISSFEIIKNNDYRIELIENFKCNDLYELRKQERFFIEKYECINKYIPTRTKEEYYVDNKIKLNKQHKEYGEKKTTCECGCIVRMDCIARHRKSKKHIELMCI
tara:strand:+ start:61 stop:528 length:468 start_codon:yes stop_codon:yes gene_type:complete